MKVKKAKSKDPKGKKTLGDGTRDNAKFSIHVANENILDYKIYQRDWKAIADKVGTRDAEQVRSHAQKYDIREEKRLLKQRQIEEAGARMNQRPTRQRMKKISYAEEQHRESIFSKKGKGKKAGSAFSYFQEKPSSEQIPRSEETEKEAATKDA